MEFGFLGNIPWFRPKAKRHMGLPLMSASALMEAPKRRVNFDIKLFRWSLLSLVPWLTNAKDKIQMPSVINKELKKQARPLAAVESAVRYSGIRFRPYVSKIPWHTGPRAFLSQLFPRYGHYCGPNWSSGKDGGSPIWDRRPIDWLDFCCYCHDIGYDTHNQAELLKADLAFIECLEKPNMNTKGETHVALLYKTMCISGMKSILIPYRKHLLKLQSGQLSIGFGWLGNMQWKGWKLKKSSR